MADTPRRRGPRPTGERLHRLLLILPWLNERGSVSVADAARQFDVSESELVADLELAALCGLPPYDYELIDLWIEDGMINIGIPRLFTRPLRLTTHEAFALLAAAEAASLLPRADPAGALDRALEKLRARLGGAVDVIGQAPHFAETVQAAVDAVEILDIEYWTPSRDEVTRRRIVPRLVFSDHGDYYVVADDERSGEERVFRIDRMLDVTPTGEIAPARSVATRPGDWFADASDMQTAVIRLAPDAQWVAERYPVRSRIDRPDGSVDVELVVASQRWLERLLLRLGTTGTVLSPDHWSDLGARTAERVLARYSES